MAMRVVTLLHRSPSPATLLRLRSTLSGNDCFFEIELSSPSTSSSSSDEASALKRLDDVVQRVMVQKATPDWLPFLPGASFWVPPRTRRRNFGDLLTSLAENLPDDADGDADGEGDCSVSLLFSGGGSSEQEAGIAESSSSSSAAEEEESNEIDEGSSDSAENREG